MGKLKRIGTIEDGFVDYLSGLSVRESEKAIYYTLACYFGDRDVRLGGRK